MNKKLIQLYDDEKYISLFERHAKLNSRKNADFLRLIVRKYLEENPI